jgi:ABC-type branched-subunit amino acid transport system substrate-binding protein
MSAERRSVRLRTFAPLVAMLMLVASACGARLTPEQRAAGIGALGQGGPADAGPGGAGPGGVGPTVGPSGLPSGIASIDAGGGGVGAPPPPGGNGGATDRGVTGNQITIASVADVSGVQPGLFKSAWQATSALAAYVNSQGGIYGRGLKPLLLDSKADSTANRAAVQEACDKAFALVGSMSAFDDGGAPVGQGCGIPDISAVTVNQARSDASNVYPAYPVSPHYYAVGKSVWIKNTFGDEVIKHAGFVILNAGVSIHNGRQRVNGLKSLGFDFGRNDERIWKVDVVTANYTPYVKDMIKKGVRYIGMLADFESIVRLQKAMKQQGWKPDVRDWDSVAYSPNYLTQGGAAVEESLVFLNTSLFEEASSNPEMQLYQAWLQRVFPGAKPDYFGMYAWSAGRLFVKAAAAVGPKLTRKALLDQVKTIHSWDAFGMHAAHDIGAKRESPCFLYIWVKGAKFVRKAPTGSGWICNLGGLVKAEG